MKIGRKNRFELNSVFIAIGGDEDAYLGSADTLDGARVFFEESKSNTTREGRIYEVIKAWDVSYPEEPQPELNVILLSDI